MRILITGAAGFVGQFLARKLLDDESGAHDIILTDVIEPPIPRGVKWPGRAKTIVADLCVDSEKVVETTLDAVYVFHGIMSSGSEANFELGMKVNFDATRILLDTLRKTCPGIRVIYASSHAVFGGAVKEPLSEDTVATPESSYGCEKMMCEYLINEYTRRGFINGLILRFPTITVRPGKPTAAASSFFSGIIREPVDGKECVIPIKNRAFQHWISSPRILIENLIHSLQLSRDALPVYNRVVLLPGISVSVQEMMDSLARVCGEEKLALLKEEDQPEIRNILYSWPARYDNTKAMGLGFHRDQDFDGIVRDYVHFLRESKSEK